MWLWALACAPSAPPFVAAPGASVVDSRPLTVGEWRAAGGPDVFATTGAPGGCPADGAATGPDAPLVCATLPEIATVLNAMSARDGLTPAFTIDGDAVTMDATADGWRIPGCRAPGGPDVAFVAPAGRAWVITDCPWPGRRAWRTEVLEGPTGPIRSSAPPLVRSPTRVVRRVRTPAMARSPALVGRAHGRLWVADRPLNRSELPASDRPDGRDCDPSGEAPGDPAGCATIAEIAEAMNARSIAEHLTPAFEVTTAGVTMDPLADGYRLPTCTEALRMYGPSDPWRGALVDTALLWEWTWCDLAPRATPAFVAYDAADTLSAWENHAEGERTRSGALSSAAAARGASRVARPVRTWAVADAGPTRSLTPLRAGGWVRRGDRLVGGAEVTRGEVSRALGIQARCDGDPPGDDLPANCVRPIDAVRLLNTWSEADGLAPAYEIDGDHVRFRSRATGWRLPTCAEVEADWEAPDPCPAGARLACNDVADLAPASALPDGGRYGNVAELAWCEAGEGAPAVSDLSATDVFWALGPSRTSVAATLERRAVGGKEAAEDVGFRAVRQEGAGAQRAAWIIAAGFGVVGAVLTLLVLGSWRAAWVSRAWVSVGILAGAALGALPSAWVATRSGAVDYRIVAPDVSPPADVVFYDVYGSDAVALAAAMEAAAPYPTKQIPHAALDWEVAWVPELVPDLDGTCRVADVEAPLRVWGAFPRWWAADPDPALAFAWRAYLDALAIEASAHRDAGERFAAWIREELPKLPPAASCEVMKADADTWVAAARAEIRTGTVGRRGGRWRPSAEVPGDGFIDAPRARKKRR